MQIEISGTNVDVGWRRTSTNGVLLVAKIDDVEERDLLEHLSISDCIHHFGEEKFLKEIGKDTAIEYFNIQEAQD